MILEVAVLNVKEGLQEQFEKDFVLAAQYISSINGYKGHSLKRCIEKENQYILLVNWQDLQSHETGFRKSPEYLQWKKLLHGYYEPFPIIEHYEDVTQEKPLV